MAHIHSAVKLNNGVLMPWLGLGVYKAEAGEEVKQAIHTALAAGYRHIDTASFYNNEESVGEAIRETSVPREEIFVTTKVWNDDQGYDETLRAFETSRQKLGLEVIDLYLIHWPVSGKFVDTWKALEKLYAEGKIRAIGVSNFLIDDLEDLMKHTEIKPSVNQVEWHPRLVQTELQEFCQKHGIQVEAWSPLGRARLLDEPVLTELAEKHGKSAAQIILRWDLQKQIVTIPKSVTPERIKQNAAIFDFELTDEDIKKIDALHTGERYGPNPADF
ncbi:aldo/keto reductase [Salisediminibacterium halotolerans]|uniref:Aldo/keto reductase n=1 Tax=Salisediminibacterium halotolerans TaxID=517425 RepID=A0A1H9WBT3_9BACI|nr:MULTISPECIES: aldo/keto reductase [Salisediminibacterium]RLJ74409.1 diketogulonate reductase-like aldo/keto reductase [Actinophytocola xinjiangensis]RPE87498.1 diketogulonate reductase-like aldo/keto reductase [Salisediminibacterium halotolerans]TWG35246.1 diketogulonate reductase-like aldo/keto reductase [Salisediminibacterium halotolerans]SES31127.1 Aldo/keto reductase [Salisediminibacterium haloalkalitolerans]GEL06726.1 glyoxal reductase [Salisediminibacterium halotolerans]